MSTDDLYRRYHRLREALAAAYAATPWNSQRIDSITAQMLPLERALGSQHAAWNPESPHRPVPADRQPPPARPR